MARRSDRGRRPFGDGEAAPPYTTVTIDTGELPPRPGGAADETETVPERRTDGAARDGRPSAGSQIGRHVVLEPLGRGGMAEVYRAFDPELNRDIALKLLQPMRSSSARARLRLQREAQALAPARASERHLGLRRPHPRR